MFCKHCGAQLGDEDVFCQKCGARIEGNSPVEHDGTTARQNMPEKPEKKKMGVVKWILIIAVIWLAVSTIVVLSMGKNQNSGTLTDEPGMAPGHTELSDYAGYTESELLNELGVEKTEFGVYPDDDHINFMCNEGKVYFIQLDSAHEADSRYTLFGIQIGDNAENIRSVLGDDFEFLSTNVSETEQRDVYIEKNTGYSLVVEYDSNFKIIRVSYVLEPAEADYEMEDSNTSQDEAISDLNIYGTYSVDNGENAVLSAEVGFYTDDGSDYIRIEALSYGDRYLAEFDGILEPLGDNTYQAVDEGFETVITVKFDSEGMLISVETAIYEDFYVLGNYYPKIRDINPDEVG